ncbi:MAG: PASTA domain-containing protein [Spirochaetales bacterium]|nr:PASTA domain-containing protein [Spirochaetales bacterium]
MEKRRFSGRFITLMVITLIFTLLLLWKYFSVMVLNSTDSSAVNRKPLIERGPILDRNGRILAIQNEMDSVEAWIPYIVDHENTALRLSEILDIDKDFLLDSFNEKQGSMWIKRKITPTESDNVHRLLDTEDMKGIYIRKEFGRNYPQQNLASHLLGYAGTDNRGLDGIEYTMDDVLSPSEHLNESDQQYGNQLFLTIDVNIQFFAEDLAKKAYYEHDADSVTILVMDAKNADILGYASIPDFDPNNFQHYTDSERKNRPIVSAYEPGSVFKAYSLASLLEQGGITFQDTFYCDGSYENDSFPEPIRCLGHHGTVSPADIIKFSCNAGAAYASDTVTNEELYSMLIGFGFGAPTQLPLPGESHGLLRLPGDWSARSKPTLAMGQEILVSAVQMITAATVFTNDGVLLKPHVVDKILSPSGAVIKDYTREPVRRLLSPGIARGMLSLMETATTTGGTAWRLKTEGIRVAAKTGTAQLTDPETGGYSDKVFGASCLAILPADDPRYITYIIIDNPKGESYYGGTIASPVIKELIDNLILYGGIPRSEDEATIHPGRIVIPPAKNTIPKGVLPDYTGYSKRELIPLFQEGGLIVNLEGEGWVIKQEPPAGTPLEQGMKLLLELE